jgi:hypothetical protein
MIRCEMQQLPATGETESGWSEGVVLLYVDGLRKTSSLTGSHLLIAVIIMRYKFAASMRY